MNNILSKVVANYAVVIDDGNQVRDENNMKVIERVYRRLRDDKEIQAQIEGIRGHPWVRVVEGK